MPAPPSWGTDLLSNWRDASAQVKHGDRWGDGGWLLVFDRAGKYCITANPASGAYPTYTVSSSGTLMAVSNADPTMNKKCSLKVGER